jgi:hypothetical protein
MSNFPAAPKLSPIWHGVQTDGVNWYLLDDFIYWSDLLNAAITVPKGRITDFASVPRPFWNVYPPWGKYGCAAIVHDELYWVQTTTREVADNILKEAMVASGCDKITVAEIYAAVSLAGQFAWDNNAHLKASGYTKLFTPA